MSTSQAVDVGERCVWKGLAMGNVQCLNTMPIPIEVGLDALLRGQKLFQSQNYEAAIESFDLAIRAGLADAHIFEMHATALQAKEWHLDAIEYFTKAIHLNDIDCNLYFMRADSKEAIGDRIGYNDDMKSAIRLANSNNQITSIYNQGAKLQGFASVAQLYESHLLLKGDAYWNLRARVRPVQHLRSGEQRALKVELGGKSLMSQQVTPDAVNAGDTRAFDLGGGVRLELVWCPPGTFTMGSPAEEICRCDDEAQHQVTLTKGFWLGKYPVTQRQWEIVMGNNPSHFKKKKLLGLFGCQTQPEHPVESVSWGDCQAFCKKLNERFAVPEGSRSGVVAGGRASLRAGEFRLPTEAEWEYACRAGTVGPYAGDLDDMGWHDRNSGKTTHPVGQKRANAWGLCDMHGNVWEWCEDWYGAYPSGSVTDPVGSASGSSRVNRGGSSHAYQTHCRSALRRNMYYHMDDRNKFWNKIIGFRVARTLP